MCAHIKENSWLAGYKNWDKLPDGAKIVFVSCCEIAMARARMKELNIEVPGSEKTPDIQFSWHHIHYGESDPPEHVVPAQWCETPGSFWQTEDGCSTHFNRVHYRKVLEYAEEWKREHPDKTECFVYQPIKPPEETAPPSASGDFTEFMVIKKWWNGKTWQYAYKKVPRRPRP